METKIIHGREIIIFLLSWIRLFNHWSGLEQKINPEDIFILLSIDHKLTMNDVYHPISFRHCQRVQFELVLVASKNQYGH